MLMRTLSGQGPHKKNTNISPYILAIRELIINKLKNEQKLDNAWMIVTWVDDAFRDKFDGMDNVNYKLMETTEEECIKRVEENEDRQESKDEQIEVIKEWFRKYKKLQDKKRLRLLTEL